MATKDEKKETPVVPAENTAAKETVAETPAMLPGGVTQAEADRWKAEHGKVFQIAVDVTEKDKAVCYLKPLSKAQKSFAATMMAKSEIYDMGEFMLNNNLIGGDPRFTQEGNVRDSAIIAAGNMFDFLPVKVTTL